MSSKNYNRSKWTGKLPVITQLFLVASVCPHPSFSQETPPPVLSPATLPDNRTDASDEALISNREEVAIVDDSNVAEAISRRPDLQYNNVTIDGERSNLSLNDIPADAVSEIELLRAVTPDMDADARGGSLNLSSNPTFNLEKPVIKADTWGNFSFGENTWQQGASASYSRALGDFGFRINASYRNEHDILEGFYLRWSQQETGADLYTPDYMTESRQEDWEISYNFGASVDYRISENLYAFARANYSENSHDGYQPLIFLRYAQGDYDVMSSSRGTVTTTQVDRDLTAYESRWSKFDFQTGLVYESDRWKFDARLLGEKTSYLEPDWFVIQFRTDAVDIDYTLNEKHLPLVSQASLDLNDPANFHFDELLSERWANDSERWVASVNLRHDFECFAIDAYFKTGLKWTKRVKDQQSDSRLYTAYLGDFTLADIAWNYGADSLLVDEVNWGVFPTLADSRRYFSEHFDQFVYDLKRSAQKGDPANFDAEERITSGYAMLNLTHNRLRGILGFRVEQTELDYHARAVIIDELGNYVTTESRAGDNRYTDFFPSLHMRYFLGSKTTLIGSWTGTIERPFYGNTVPYQYIDYDSRSIDAGNPKLQPTLFSNFDFSIDYKLTDTSLFSIELFSREVEDIVYWEVTEITAGQYAGFTVGTHTNGPTATERGARFILTQNLADLSDALDGFSLILKYSLQSSETQYPGRDFETLPVTYRPENTFEATLTYQGEKLYVQVQYSLEDAELVSVYEAAWQDKYDIPNEHLSISTSYNFSDSVRFYCDFSGLLESYAKTYYGVPSRPSAYAWRSKKVEFGVKINL